MPLTELSQNLKLYTVTIIHLLSLNAAQIVVCQPEELLSLLVDIAGKILTQSCN